MASGRERTRREPLSPDQHRRVCELFWQARDLEPQARAAFVDERTADAPALRAELLAMLTADATAAIDAAIRSGLGREAAALVDQSSSVRPGELDWANDRYELQGELGTGGMGTVYLARDRLLDREVALKVLHRLSAEHTHRFFNEVRVHARLDHPNIVPVHNVGFHGRGPFYTMRVVRGRTLHSVLVSLADGDEEDVAEFSLARRIRIFVDVCQAVAYAHGRGIVHRDLKPANVMLGPYGEVQVLDWGLSRVTGDSLEPDLDAAQTQAGQVVGTPAYMAPEQIRGEKIDGRADLYALGVILYELLTLTRPFSGDSKAVMQRHLNDQPEPPLRRAPQRSVPLELQKICLLALRKKAADRCQSVAEMTAIVQSWLEASADREKRQQLAEAKAEEGRRALLEYRRQHDEVEQLETAAKEARDRFEPWQPAEEKAEARAPGRLLLGTVRRRRGRERRAGRPVLRFPGDALPRRQVRPRAARRRLPDADLEPRRRRGVAV